jgi:hypothetical protein
MKFWKDGNMPHLDEGQLHALLDGAYPQDSPEALQIQAHIAECAQCRAQLDQERALRDRAALILRAARPGSEEVPPFERVLQRASQPKRRVGVSAPARLAWAASIMLALGAGWISRGIFPAWRSSQSAEQPAQQSESVTPAAPAPAPGVSAPAEARDLRQSAPKERSEVRSQPPAQAGERDRSTPSARAAAPTAQADQANAPLTRSELGGVAGSRRTDSTSNKVVATPPPAAPPPPSSAEPARAQRAAEALSLSEVVVTGIAAAPINWNYTSQNDAQRIAGRKPLIVDDLQVVNLGVANRAGVWLFRVTQRLPDGNTIELIEEPIVERDNRSTIAGRSAVRGQTFTEESARLDETGTLLMTLRRGDLKITARATLPQDSLRALLERLR